MIATALRILVGALTLSVAAANAFAAPKIGVLLKGRSNFWSAVEKGAVEAGQQTGAEIVVKAPLAESDVSVQIQLLNSFANQGFDAVVLAPSHKDALAAPTAALIAKGIKVVVIDSPLELKDVPVFIGTDHNAAGEAAGHLLAKLVNGDDEVIFLRHMQNNPATMTRENGAMLRLREAHPRVTVRGDIYASTEKDAELQKAKLALSTYPKAKAILASGTPGAMAMLQALKQQPTPGAVKLVGFGFNLNADVASAIDSGIMSGWIAQLPKDVGAKGVHTALALLKNEKVEPVVNVDFVAITKENLKEPSVQALLKL